jgi:hypothetical protein
MMMRMRTKMMRMTRRMRMRSRNSCRRTSSERTFMRYLCVRGGFLLYSFGMKMGF